MGSVFGTTPPHDVTFSRSDILVSEDVVERLRHQLSDEVSPETTAPTRSSPPPQVHTKEELPSEASVNTVAVASQCLTHSRDEVERKYEALLRKFEERNDKYLKTAEEEYTRVVDRLSAKYLKHNPVACCVDAQKQVVDCYKTNGQRSLNCSKEVESFVRCVAAFRSARMGHPDAEVL
ncbi:coiled coil helix coiled coil helix [Echinococcus multilocularis]|uniref:Coiled coil helix coiled coil helix n=1 Tax=Echinococcus multilocularis TaxID=6211 RepID=A0A068YCN1_ECHMU|nr:coiled coil helix coiled coil helix [Echinococcus multilocularis]